MEASDGVCYTDETLRLHRKGNGLWLPQKNDAHPLDSLGLGLVQQGTIGEGLYTKVKKMYCRKTTRTYAVKVFYKLKAPKEVIDKYLPREITIMKMLGHERLVALEGAMMTDKHAYILMEYLPGGDLLNYVNKRGHLSEEEARAMFRHILDAVTYMHALDIVHRDIKCDNIFIDRNDDIKIGDFGFATMCLPGQKLTQHCGSYAYTAPEVLEGLPYDGKAADIWSMGVVLYSMLCGRLPYHDECLDILIDSIYNPQEKLRFHKRVSKDCRDFVRAMLTADPKSRATVDELKHMHWLNRPIDKSTAAYSTPVHSESSLLSICAKQEGLKSLDMSAEHGFFEDHRKGAKTSKEELHRVSDILRAVAVRHVFGTSTTNLQGGGAKVTQNMGAIPIHLWQTDLGITGPAKKRISVQLSQADLSPMTGMAGTKSGAFNKVHTIGGVHHHGNMHRKSSLMLLTHPHHAPVKHGGTLKRGSLIVQKGSITASGSQIMMGNEELMRSATRLHQDKIDKELHDMHFYIAAKVAALTGSKKHHSVEAIRRNSLFTETLKLRSIPNALDPEEQAMANYFRSKLQHIMD